MDPEADEAIAALPVPPPIEPMLARLVRDVPTGDFIYEPKWDGFRCLAFKSGPDVDLRSRHDRPLARYFPELVAAFRALPAERVVLDGEIVLVAEAGFDFALLLSRLHPAASRVERLSREAPARYIAFDILAEGDVDLTNRPFVERRRRLEALFEVTSLGDALAITPATRDPDRAREWFARFQGAGIDGLVAKPLDLPYQPGRRAMTKVKHERTADVVVAGFRPLPDGSVSSLLLGLYDEVDALRHVGVVTQLARADRVAFGNRLGALAIPIERHPWRSGFAIGASPLGRLKGSASRWTPEMVLDWVPLPPSLVCEVGFDQVDVDRFRHPARFRRWRPDREPLSCRLDQIVVEGRDLGEFLAAGSEPAATEPSPLAPAATR
jgi:ATP-dependent DNA ligase